MEVGKLNTKNLAKSTPYILQEGFGTSEEIETRLTQRFSQLEADLRKEQLTCKIKFAVLICGLFALQWMFL